MSKLLLIVPDPERLDALAAILRGRGHDVATATDARNAIEHTTGRPDAVILDVSRDGERAKLDDDTRLHGVPVIVLSDIAGVDRELPLQTVAVLIGAPVRKTLLLEVLDRVAS